MLAELFMMRLEATSRASRETAPSSNSRFVPYRVDLLEQKSDEANRYSPGLLELQPDGYSTRST
jgi:hypothetical protein